jgi:hypothetical protein
MKGKPGATIERPNKQGTRSHVGRFHKVVK